ncbi:MAG: argininosuccinate lyase [Clostridiales bacterium]|jgi:argininosuccinate lyase|nr:argininosuccinate lyase [Clostridiales bacterium]
MSEKLWGGRFSSATDARANDFQSSIRFDARLYRQDIAGSVAHASMLGRQGIIPANDAAAIVTALKALLADIEDGKAEFSVDAEDIHMNIEKLLTERIAAGTTASAAAADTSAADAGKRLHTARSRNDQVALDLRMYLKDEIAEITGQLAELVSTLLRLAAGHTATIMPGYTHLQRAQPITLAHHLMAYVEMYLRDADRLLDCRGRTDVMPLGAGALAGVTYPVDRQFVADALGFPAVSQNSLDAVSDRDFVLELLSCLSILMVHLSRSAEELVLWSTLEFGFIEMDDAYSTGSSIMPQKKNPDVAELIRGKSGRVFGDLFALLTVMKGLPLAYNKDLQEDKEAVFDAVDTVRLCLPVYTQMLATMKIHKEAMYLAAQKGFANATDFADYLVKKGLPFRDAHEVTGRLVLHCIGEGLAIEDLSLAALREFSGVVGEDVYDAISLEACLAARNGVGGPAKEAVEAAISGAAGRLEALRVSLSQIKPQKE